MPMTPPTPHRVSSTRITRADGETYTSPAVVLTAEPALVVPAMPSETMGTMMGPAEVGKYIMFIGYSADVKLDDIITNDVTGDKYIVVEPPVPIQRPTDFSNDHQQVGLRLAPVQ